VRIAEDTIELRLIIKQQGLLAIEATLIGGGVLFRSSLNEGKGLALALFHLSEAGDEITQILQNLTLRAPSSPRSTAGVPVAPVPKQALSSSNSAIPQKTAVELVNSFAVVPLEMAIEAVQNAAIRLSEPATIAPEQIEELLLKSFMNKRVIKSKINSALAQANVRIPMDDLAQALNKLVAQGHVKREERTATSSGRNYTLYAFGDAVLDTKVPVEDRLKQILQSFGSDAFTIEDFSRAAQKVKISPEEAQEFFHQEHQAGGIYRPFDQDPRKFKRIE
jgi:predicted transcriptional regulator